MYSSEYTIRCVVVLVCLAGLLGLLSQGISSATCPPLESKTTDIACFHGQDAVNCSQQQHVGTRGELACKPGFMTSSNNTYKNFTCLDTGEWDRPVIPCIPDCGRRNSNSDAKQISGGGLAKVREFPWNVAIYQERYGEYILICGGSLLTTKIVVSVAQCFWDRGRDGPKNASLYRVAAGKLRTVWFDDDDDRYVQRHLVERIDTHPDFHGRHSRFQSDIALVRLSMEVDITANVNLICIDWENRWETSQLIPGNNGTFAGWGFTTEGTLSSSLRQLELPFEDRETCYNAMDVVMRPFLTLDKICAGYVNRSVSICRGDSGGGLVYRLDTSGRYYLRGLASVSFVPFDNTDVCYSQFYGGFTLVSYYLDWIMKHSL